MKKKKRNIGSTFGYFCCHKLQDNNLVHSQNDSPHRLLSVGPSKAPSFRATRSVEMLATSFLPLVIYN